MNNFKQLKWEVRQRLTAIETTLLWKGKVIRKDLMDLFGIKSIQAAKDFSKYNELFPKNITYDKFQKAYIASDFFKSRLIQGNAEEFLHLLKTAPLGENSPTVVLLGALPSVELITPIERNFETIILQKTNQAICDRLKIGVLYQSMNKENPEQLTLSPHSLVHNGFRWHIRAYSDSHKQYRDFLLARIKPTPEILGQAEYSSDSDQLWNTFIELRVAPHPGLSTAQKRIIEDDYGMIDGEFKIGIRAAVAGYYLQLMKIGPGDETQPANKQQIILVNKDQLTPYLF